MEKTDEQIAPQTQHHDYELRPNGQTTQFVKGLSCLHDWRRSQGEDCEGVQVELDGETLQEDVCVDCGAFCLRDADGNIQAYDNTDGLDLGDGGARDFLREGR